MEGILARHEKCEFFQTGSYSPSCHEKFCMQIQNAIYFSVMIDETSNCSNKEQVVLVFSWVDEDLVVHEDILGSYLTKSLMSAAQLLKMLLFFI